MNSYCIDCNCTLPVTASPQRELCDECAKSRHLSREIDRYYKRKLAETFHAKKVMMIQSPYFSEQDEPIVVGERFS